MKTLPTFTQSSIKELTAMLAAKLSGQAVIVYQTIASFDFSKSGTAFPKVETIRKMLDYKIGKRQVYWCLAKLVKVGLLRRNKARHGGKVNKRRFVFLERHISDFIRRVRTLSSIIPPIPRESLSKMDQTSTDVGALSHTRRENRKRQPLYPKIKSKSFSSQKRSRYIGVKEAAALKEQHRIALKEVQSRCNSGDFAIARLIAGVPTNELTEPQRDALKRGEYDKDWLQEYHPKLFEKLKQNQRVSAFLI